MEYLKGRALDSVICAKQEILPNSNFLEDLAKQPYGTTVKVSELPKEICFSTNSKLEQLICKYRILSFNPKTMTVKFNSLLEYNAVKSELLNKRNV